MAEPIQLLTPREETAQRIAESLRRQLGEFYHFLEDDQVVEISCNPDGRVFVDRLGEPLQCVGVMRHAAIERFISDIAATVRRVINYDHPSLHCRLPIGGHRFQAVCPPTSTDWLFSIRRHASAVYLLEDYVQKGIMTDLQFGAINLALTMEEIIFITGGTGSGKTTLLNSCIAHPALESSRIIIGEDTPEIIWRPQMNVVAMCTNDTTTMRDIVVQAMRLAPDRLIIGETREGASLLEVLKACNTGHRGGMTTLHANSSRHGLSKIEMLIREVSQDPLRELIAETVQVMIHIEKIVPPRPPFRRVTTVSALRGYRRGDYELVPLA